MITIIVSPMARDMPSTKEAMIPDNAAGTTTRIVVSNLVAPKADDPSRMDWGTEFIASSDMDAIIGIIMTPITIPGLKIFVGSSDGITTRKIGVTKVNRSEERRVGKERGARSEMEE